MLFLFLFVAIPLVELYVLIEVGSEIGALSAIGLSIFTAVLGGALVRLQGLSVLFRVQGTLANGEVPAIEMLEGAMLMLAGLMLLLPGFITDVLGFLILIPPVRKLAIVRFLRHQAMLHPAAPPHRKDHSGFIEGEFRRHDSHRDDH